MQRQTHCGLRAFVFVSSVQPAASVKRETKGRGRLKDTSVTPGKVKERQGEGGEGRKEREGGRSQWHEEGRLTDIAGLAISSHTHTHTYRHRQTDTHAHSARLFSAQCLLFFVLCGALSSILSSPLSKRTGETQREGEEEVGKGQGGGGEGKGRGGEAVTLSFT